MKVLKFEASWCGPCKMLSKVLEGAEGKYAVEIVVVDIDENPDIAKQYGIRSVPTMVKVDGDVEVSRKVGMMSEPQLLEFLA